MSNRRFALCASVIGSALCTAICGAAQAGGLDIDDSDAYAEPAVAMAAVSEPAMSFALARHDAGRRDPGALRVTLEGRVDTLTGLRPQLRQGGISTTLIDVSNRVWLGTGRAAFGLGVGARTAPIDPPFGIHETVPLQPARPSLSVGWRYSVTPSLQLDLDATAARTRYGDDGLPRYNAKAGVEWKSARSRLGFDGARLALQLDSGYRMSIRTRSGGLQIALRRTF